MERLQHPFNHEWHVSINKYTTGMVGSNDWPSFMYEAKTLADEVPRMVMLFKQEREQTLPETHKQCSQQKAVPVKNNHITCCLGVKTKECPYLLALENIDRCDPEQSDIAKAWTCAAHIVSKGGDMEGTGYLLRVDDKMYWDSVHESLSSECP